MDKNSNNVLFLGYSSKEKGYDESINCFGPAFMADLLSEMTYQKDAQNKTAKFCYGDRVKVVATMEEIISLLTSDNTYTLSKARMIALLMLRYGGIIDGTDIIEGERYYHVLIGPERQWYILPEKYLQKG